MGTFWDKWHCFISTSDKTQEKKCMFNTWGFYMFLMGVITCRRACSWKKIKRLGNNCFKSSREIFKYDIKNSVVWFWVSIIARVEKKLRKKFWRVSIFMYSFSPNMENVYYLFTSCLAWVTTLKSECIFITITLALSGLILNCHYDYRGLLHFNKRSYRKIMSLVLKM